MTDSHRQFDLFLSFYDAKATPASGDGLFYEIRPGMKVEGLSGLLAEHAASIREYTYFAIFDEDIEATTQDLNTLFQTASDHGFRICQPSLTHDSFFTYAGLLQNKAFEYRAVTFVEMMCPVFHRDMLEAISHTYTLGYESGIDLIWCNMLDPEPGDYAVIDKVAVRHTQPVGLRKADNGFSEKQYEVDIFAIMRLYALPWLPCIPYFAVRRTGNREYNRFILFLYSVPVVSSVFKNKPYFTRLRSLLTHWKHIIFSRPKNMNIDIYKTHTPPEIDLKKI